MAVTLADLQRWLAERESPHLEFKEAKNTFSEDYVQKYVVALGNEGGGHLVLGVADRVPRNVVGSNAFRNIDGIQQQLYQKFRKHIPIVELEHEGKRVVVFEIPGRPRGVPLELNGAFLMRSGESVIPMTPERLREIFDELTPDFTDEVCAGATFDDLDAAAIARLLDLWSKKAGEDKRRLGDRQALEDLGLIKGTQIRYGALILLGKREALRAHLADAEIIYEYRANPGAIASDKREELRAGFLLTMDELWRAIDARNDVQHFQDGLVIRDVPTLREDAVREALLNAVSHREYRQPGSIFIKQSPRELIVSSPGGLPAGVTVDTIVAQQRPRNRLLAETLQRIGLVERAGQGADKMFRSSIADSKRPPTFTGTDAQNVVVTLHGQVEDIEFVRSLDALGRDVTDQLSALDYIVLDHVRRGEPVPPNCSERVDALVEAGLLVRSKRKLLLHPIRMKAPTGKREAQKVVIQAFLAEHPEGSSLDDVRTALGGGEKLSRSHFQRLLAELQTDGRAHVTGKTKAARWYAGPEKKRGD